MVAVEQVAETIKYLNDPRHEKPDETCSSFTIGIYVARVALFKHRSYNWLIRHHRISRASKDNNAFELI